MQSPCPCPLFFLTPLSFYPQKKNSLVLWVGVAAALDATPGSPQPQQGDIDILYACKQLNIHQSSPPRNVWHEPEHLLIRIFFWPERLLYPILVHVQILIAITIHVLKGTVGILVILCVGKIGCV